MHVPEKVFIALLAALFMGVALPAGNPATGPEPVREAQPATTAATLLPTNPADPSRADLLAAMRPVLDRMRESLGLPADSFSRDMSDKDRLDALVKETQEPVSCAIGKPDRPRHFNFLLATVPDYVDSNTAWMADEVLGAIQAAMPHSGYVLDQFYLPEIPHNAGAGASTADSSTAPRLHEIQPGVIIFRGECGWQVVLIVLETATSGLHVAAFENAARFIALWQNRTLDPAQTDPTQVFRELRIIGPTFSGAVDVMVISLKRVATAFESIHILSGSATADTNATKFAPLCKFRRDCSYATAMHSNWTTVGQLCGFLREMNPSWVPGRVGVLQEYNTSFGMAFDLKADDPSGCSFRAYKFPLHIAQLRADTRAAPELPLILTPPPVALKLGDRVRPADLVPPMRPDVASPLTDRSIAAMLDDIRHRGLAAVGIYATDIRDALFLSREIKRAAPDVQLFFPSAHLMYLHRDFVAYTRGAIVASTYPLSAMPQLWGGTVSPLREVFTSTVAQGVFIATLTQATRSGGYLPDYPYGDARLADQDSVGSPKLGPKPGIWLSIIGDDGFWPLRQVPYPAGIEMTRPLMNQWPRSVALASVLLALIIVAHAGAFLLTWNWSAGPRERARSAAKWADRLRELPILGALAPPAAFEEFGRLHRLMSASVHILVGCLAFWMGTVIFVNQFGADSTMAAAVWLVPLAASTIAVLSPARVVSPWSTLPQVQTRTIVRPFRAAEALVGACWILPIAALLFSVVSTYWWRGTLEPTAMLAAARTIGGGIASPGASTVCLLAVMYVPAFWSLRRLGALGYGYGTIARSSTAFRRLLGSEEQIASFASLLDVPARHLPRSYFFAIVLTMLVVTGLILDNVATVEGTAYTLFLSTASLIGLGAVLVFMAQSLEIWRRLRVLLTAMADLPLAAALSRVGMSHLQWNISIFPPDTRDLRVPVGLAAELRDRIQDARVAALLGPETEVALDRVMREDRRERQAAALTLTQSATWLQLWELSDALLPAVASCRWVKCGDKGVQGSVCTTQPSAVAACLDCCETLLATARALVLRDITSRIMSGIFAAMVVLGLLAAAHLLYVFQGRASFLTVDAAVLGVASLAAVWILIGMEKDAILSLIWRTTPGRVSFNWALVQRLIVFGVLPLLAVLGSMFPEVGERVVRLLDPLRRLTSL